MAMTLRCLIALGLVLAFTEGSNLRGDISGADPDDPNAQVSQADINKAMSDATAGDHLDASDISLSADTGGEESEEDKEEEAAEREGEENMRMKREERGESSTQEETNSESKRKEQQPEQQPEQQTDQQTQSGEGTEKQESSESQLAALVAKKNAAVAAEDYDEANTLKKEIIALKAQSTENHDAEVAALEAKKKAAVAAEDYDEANKIKKEIAALKDQDQVPVQARSTSQEQQPEPQQEQQAQSDDDNGDRGRSHDESLLSTEKPQSKKQEQPEEEQEKEPQHHKKTHLTREEFAKQAEQIALKSTQVDDEEAKAMADFDAKHPDVSDKAEDEFQKKVQEAFDSTTETEEDAELEMKAHEIQKQKRLSNGGEFESVDDVRAKMQQEKKDSEARKKELAGFDDFFSGSSSDTGSATKGDLLQKALPASLIPAKSSAGAAGMGDMGAMMSMFSGLLGGAGGMGGMGQLGVSAQDKLSHVDAEKPVKEPVEAEPVEHHPDGATKDLMKTLSQMAKGGTMDIGALVSMAGGADKGKAKQGLLAIDSAPKAIDLANKDTAPAAKVVTEAASDEKKVVKVVNHAPKVVKKAIQVHKKVSVPVKVVPAAPKVEAPKKAAAKVDEPKKVAAKVESPKKIVAKIDAPKKVAAKVELPKQVAAKVVAVAKPAAVVAAVAKSSDADLAEDKDVEDAEKAAAAIDAEVNAEMGTA